MDYFDFYRTAYKNEAERRSQLSSLLPIPIGIFTVIGGAFFVMVQGIHPPLEAWEIVCSFLLGIAVILGIAAAFNLVRFQFGHEYTYLPPSEAIEGYRQSLIAYYARRGMYGSIVDDDVKERVQADYVRFATLNASANNKKTQYLYRTNSCLAACALCTLAASIPFSLSKINGAEPNSQVSVAITIDRAYHDPIGGYHERRRGREGSVARARATGGQQTRVAGSNHGP